MQTKPGGMRTGRRARRVGEGVGIYWTALRLVVPALACTLGCTSKSNKGAEAFITSGKIGPHFLGSLRNFAGRSSIPPPQGYCGAEGLVGLRRDLPGRSRRGGHSLSMSMNDWEERSSGSDSRPGRTKRRFEKLLEEGKVKECVRTIKQSGADLDVDMGTGAKVLDMVAKELYTLGGGGDDKFDEDIIADTYSALKGVGLLPAFGSIDLDLMPAKTRDREMSTTKLHQLTGLEMKNLTPTRAGNWIISGITLCGLEYLLAEFLGMDPLQTLIPATLGVFALDRLFTGGAYLETVARMVVPEYKEKVVKHEAGHFLLAYLLGCPVQGCLLDPFEISKIANSAQGGTIFADPAFAKGIQSGRLTRSTVDRFTIVLMAGIAAEAMEYGAAEGGASDEAVLMEVLSTIVPPFKLSQIQQQARWAAVQAVLLLREHKEAYDALVVCLERGDKLGECVTELELQLAKKPLPGVTRKAAQKPPSVSEDVRRMMEQRIQQQQWQQWRDTESSRGKGKVPQSRGAAMADLRRRVEELEKRISASGDSPTPNPGTSPNPKAIPDGPDGDGQGVWINNLRALSDEILASSEKEMAEMEMGLADKDLNIPGVSDQSLMGIDLRVSEPSPGPSPKPKATNRGVSEDKLNDLARRAELNAARLAEVDKLIDKLNVSSESSDHA